MLSLRRVLDGAPALKLPAPGAELVDLIDYFLASVPGLAVFLMANTVMTIFTRGVLRLAMFPPPLIGMLIFFFTMLGLKERDAAKVVAFFDPAVVMLTNFLPVFFLPGLLNAPAAMAEVALVDFLKFCLIVIMGMAIITIKASLLSEFIISSIGGSASAASPPSGAGAPLSAPKFTPWFSQQLENVFGLLASVSGGAALVVPSMQGMYYITATVFAFIFSSRFPRHMTPTVRKFVHPLIITYVTGTILLVGQGALRGFRLSEVLAEYLSPSGDGAGNAIMFFLQPAILSFAFGLYARRKLLQANALAILSGSLSSAVVGILIMASLARLVGVPKELGMSLLPRATTALAVAQARMIGASTALTTLHCCFIGLTAGNFSPILMDFFSITNPISRGLGVGGSGLALGAAAIASSEPGAFPFAVLTMAITSTISTMLYSIPAFQRWIFGMAGLGAGA
jgi:putative effector of murein hydrolase